MVQRRRFSAEYKREAVVVPFAARHARIDGAAVLTRRSLLCRCHRERCDPNTYVPLRPDALNG
jgi:hypothetical protein